MPTRETPTMHPTDLEAYFQKLRDALRVGYGLHQDTHLPSRPLARLLTVVCEAYAHGFQDGHDACKDEYSNGDMEEERR